MKINYVDNAGTMGKQKTGIEQPIFNKVAFKCAGLSGMRKQPIKDEFVMSKQEYKAFIGQYAQSVVNNLLNINK